MESSTPPRIIVLYNIASQSYDLGHITLLPLRSNLPGTWMRIALYGPEMEQYKPFLYIDLDTAIISSIENIFDLVKDESKFITLEDFWQKGQLATGLVWFPSNCKKTQNIWQGFKSVTSKRMDVFIRRGCKPDLFWQQITNTIFDFKPKPGQLLSVLPKEANLVCFHGKPRIFEASNIKWVKDYIEYE